MPRAGLSLRWGLLFAVVVVLVLAAVPETAWAGPGGVFVKAAAKSVWVRIGLGVVAILFLPLALYVVAGERLGIWRTRKALRELARTRPEFDWGAISDQAKDAVTKIYGVWESGDLGSVADQMTQECYDSQQAMLDRWHDEGKRNVIDLHAVRGLFPLFVRTESDESLSVIAVLLKATVIDYLEDSQTRKLLKGTRSRDNDFEAVWVFAHVDGRWRVNRIEEGNTSLAFAKLKNEIDLRPAPGGYASEPAVTQTLEHEAAAEQEGTEVKVARGK